MFRFSFAVWSEGIEVAHRVVKIAKKNKTKHRRLLDRKQRTVYFTLHFIVQDNKNAHLIWERWGITFFVRRANKNNKQAMWRRVQQVHNEYCLYCWLALVVSAIAAFLYTTHSPESLAHTKNVHECGENSRMPWYLTTTVSPTLLFRKALANAKHWENLWNPESAAWLEQEQGKQKPCASSRKNV